MSNLPKGWEEVKLGEILNIQTGKKNAQDSKENGEYPFFTRSIDTQKIDTYSFDTEALFIAGEGNFTVKYYKGKFDLHQRTYMLTALKENTVDLKFLQNNIQPKVYQLVATSVGSTVQSLRKPIIEALKIPLPPLEEQKKIADILSTVDKKIAFVEKNINATEELKKGLMQKLLTEGIGHTKFKDSELGRIPESWEVETLGKIGTFSKGKGISKNEIVENGYPCIRYAEIYTEYNFVIKEFKSFINQESANNSNKLKRNDILFAGSGETLEDIGKSVAFLFDIEAYVGGDTIILSPKDNILDSLFMAYQLNFYEVRKQLIKLGQGNSVVHIYSKGLMTVKVKFPPLEEQKQIAEILSTVDNKLENLKEKKQYFEELKKGLMQKLLTGEVRV